MARPPVRLSPLLPALLALVPLPSPAQQPGGTQAVPAELALALIGDQEAALSVGAAPPPLAALALPAGARVLGGMTQARASMAVAAVALEAGPALDAAGAALAADGWTPASFRVPGRIFEDSGAPERPRTFCGPGASVRVSAVAAAGGGTVLRYVRSALPGGFNVCNPPPGLGGPGGAAGPLGGDQPIEAAPIPLLVNPEGLRQRGGGMSGGPGSREAVTHLATPLGPLELASHYQRQLAEQGWTLVAGSEGAEAVAQSWRRQDDDGRRWHGLLLVTPLPDGTDKELFFRIWDPTVAP